MIDFIKTEIYGPDVADLINHPQLNFITSFEIKTGEVKTEIQTAEFQNMKFIIKDNRFINFQGSLHKYYTNGVNFNDFTMQEIRLTLAKITELFKVDLHLSRLHNIEYGVNIKLPFNPRGIINSLINHKGDQFDRMSGKARRTGRECGKQQYILKIYDKGHQCRLGYFLLRVEIKVIKMQYLKKYDIQTLADLLDHDKLKCLMDDLVNAFNEILMYDPKIDLTKCSKPDADLLIRGRSFEFWRDLKAENKKMHDYYRRKFRQLSGENGQNTQQKVAELILDKANLLLKPGGVGLSKLTDFNKHPMDHNNHLSGMLKGQVKLTTSANNCCHACWKKIVNRKSVALYCGEECRIRAKNRRRDIKRPLQRFIRNNKSNPVLFDTAQYLKLTTEQIKVSKLYNIYEKLISV